MKEIIEWLVCVLVAVIIALLVRFFLGTPTIVQQSSMFPTLIENQRLWLNRWPRTTKTMPERGDIITFEAPSRTYVGEEEIDLMNPVAKYENEPKGWFNKFLYYVLEEGKISYIKRVIALPGEHVEIKNGKVYINGEALDESSYLQSGVVTDLGNGLYTDFYVPENTVFALGDNRTESTDCRCFGCIPLEKIESKVAFRFWPLNLFGNVD